jgi:ABC-type multidrug transport system ATPase subunit
MTQGDSQATFVVRGASKAFGVSPVLRELSFCANPGEVTLILGANGSGKSTLLRICAGLLRADTGSVTFRSILPVKSQQKSQRIGYIGHHSLVYGAMTVYENIELFSQLVGHQATKDLLQRWDLERFATSLARDLSRGTLLRLGLCRAFMGTPSALL